MEVIYSDKFHYLKLNKAEIKSLHNYDFIIFFNFSLHTLQGFFSIGDFITYL